MPTMDKDKDKVASGSLETGISLHGGAVVKSGVSVQRRKLIKASAAAMPVIVTLRSGAVAAATSALGCVEKDVNAPAADTVVPAEDTWVRKIATKKVDLKIKIDGKQEKKATYLIVDGKYYKWDDTSSYDLVNGSGETITEKSSDSGVVTSTVYVLCYIEFDAYGNVLNITYYPDLPGDGAQVTASCLCSVNPDYNLPV